MLDERWKDEYVKTPEHFRRLVTNTVEMQLRSDIADEGCAKQKRHIERRGYLRVAMSCCLILLVLLAGTGIVAKYDSIYKWIGSLGVNQKHAEELLITDFTTEATTEELKKEETTEFTADEMPAIFKLYDLDPEIAAEAVRKTPSLELESLYVDGTYLVFTANLSKDAEGPAPGGAKDHALVNGQDCLMVDFKEEPLGSNHYECKIDLTYAEQLQGDEVEVSLFLMPVEDFTFKAKIGDNFKETRKLPAQTIDLGVDGKVEVNELTISPSQLTVQLHLELKGDDAIQIADAYTFFMKLVDSEGCSDAEMKWMDIGDVITKEDGTVIRDITLSATKFDAGSDTLTLIPCSFKTDEEGKCISGTEEWLTEKAVTIPLK